MTNLDFLTTFKNDTAKITNSLDVSCYDPTRTLLRNYKYRFYGLMIEPHLHCKYRCRNIRVGLGEGPAIISNSNALPPIRVYPK